MQDKTEMDVYFEDNITEARVHLEGAQANYDHWVQAYNAWKLAVENGEMHRRKPPSRQSVAALIKASIFSFTDGRRFTARDVFDAMPQENLDYDKTRLSISAWLQHFVKEERVKKVERGTYALVLTPTIQEPGVIPGLEGLV